MNEQDQGTSPTLLGTIPTARLIDELTMRCAPAIFMGHKDEGYGKGPIVFFRYSGRESVCYSLCQALAFEIQSSEIRAILNER